MSEKKAVILFADGFEEVEALTVLDALVRAGIKVDKCGVTGLTVTSSHKVPLVCDFTIDEIEDEYDLVFLPGGMPGSTNLAQSWPVNELLVKQAQKKDCYIGAICAAPAAVLARAGLLEGHEATCYPGCGSMAPYFTFSEEGVVVSGNIVTGKSAGHAWPLGFALITLLMGKEASDKVRNEIYYLC